MLGPSPGHLLACMARVSMNPFAVSEPAVHSARCRRMWVLVGANTVAGSSGVPLMKVFAMDLVKIALFVDFLVSNLFTVFE